jgi:hypothetical protein
MASRRALEFSTECGARILSSSRIIILECGGLDNSCPRPLEECVEKISKKLIV